MLLVKAAGGQTFCVKYFMIRIALNNSDSDTVEFRLIETSITTLHFLV